MDTDKDKNKTEIIIDIIESKCDNIELDKGHDEPVITEETIKKYKEKHPPK